MSLDLQKPRAECPTQVQAQFVIAHRSILRKPNEALAKGQFRAAFLGIPPADLWHTSDGDVCAPKRPDAHHKRGYDEAEVRVRLALRIYIYIYLSIYRKAADLADVVASFVVRIVQSSVQPAELDQIPSTNAGHPLHSQEQKGVFPRDPTIRG